MRKIFFVCALLLSIVSQAQRVISIPTTDVIANGQVIQRTGGAYHSVALNDLGLVMAHIDTTGAFDNYQIAINDRARLSVANIFSANNTFNANILTPATTSPTVGVLMKEGVRFLHAYTDPDADVQADTRNLFLGYEAGNFTMGPGASPGVLGGRNTGIGYKSGQSITTGSQETFLGHLAGQKTTTGPYNTFIGAYAGVENTTGGNNTFVGADAGWLNTIGESNVFIGTYSGQQNTEGESNVVIGKDAFRNNLTGDGNIAIGESALKNATANNNNVAIGYQTQISASGNNNVSLGAFNLTSASGHGNTALGSFALQSQAAGAQNVGVGYNSGATQTSADFNTFLGSQSGLNVTTGGNNIVIGALSGRDITNETNNILIGYDATLGAAGQSGQLNIQNIIWGNGNTGTGATLSTGNIGIGIKDPDQKLDVDGMVEAVALRAKDGSTLKGSLTIKAFSDGGAFPRPGYTHIAQGGDVYMDNYDEDWVDYMDTVGSTRYFGMGYYKETDDAAYQMYLGTNTNTLFISSYDSEYANYWDGDPDADAAYKRNKLILEFYQGANTSDRAAQIRMYNSQPLEIVQGGYSNTNRHFIMRPSADTLNTQNFTINSQWWPNSTFIINRYHDGNNYASANAIVVNGTRGSPTAPTAVQPNDYFNGYSFYSNGTSGGAPATPSFQIRHIITSTQGSAMSEVNTSFMNNSTAVGTPFPVITLLGNAGNIRFDTYTTNGYVKTTGANGTLSISSTVPVSDLTGLGTGVATWLATPSSANLITAVTDETGTGSLVFGTSPQFGNIGVGMAASSRKIDVTQSTSNQYAVSILNNAGTGVSYGLQVQGGTNSSDVSFRVTNSGGSSIPLGVRGDGLVWVGGTTGMAAAFNVVNQAEQVRVLYDASNYYSTSVSSAGAVTYDAVGSGATFLFSDNLASSTQVVAPIIATSGTTINANFATVGATASSFNGSTVSNANFVFGGAANVTYRTHFYGSTSSVITANASASNVIFAGAPSTESTTGTHAWNNNVTINGHTITDGTATTTNAASLFINAAPTGATNNYAFYISSGNSITQTNFAINTGLYVGNSFSQTASPLFVGNTAVSQNVVTFGGATNVSAGFISNRTSSHTIAVNNSYSAHIFGASPATEAASGTHAWIVNTLFKPVTITDAAATTTNSATVYIDGAATGATNNYAFYISAGDARLNGWIYANGGLTVGGTNSLQNNFYAPNGASGNGSTAQLMFGGSGSTRGKIFEFGSTSTSLSTGESFAAHIIGQQTITEFSSGTHANVATFLVRPLVITDAAATTTNSYTIYIDGAATGATNNYALYVVSGTNYFGGKITQDATITGGGTTGNQTINKPTGTVNFAAAATTLTVTNSLVTTSSIVYAVVRTADATAEIKSVVPGSGSFVITLSAAATAETSVGFIVFN